MNNKIRGISVAFFFMLLFIFFTPSASAQFANCDTISLTPDTLSVGEPVTVVKSDTLIAGEFVRATVLNVTPTPITESLNCLDSPSSCIPAPTSLFEIDTSSLTVSETYEVNIEYIDADGDSCEKLQAFTLVGDARSFCSPSGLTGISPPNPDEATRIEFSGCTGGGPDGGGSPCSGSTRIAITDVLLGIVVGEYTITDSGIDSCEANGDFTTSISGLTFGVYEAQLTSGGAGGAREIGDVIEFEVSSALGSSPGDACSLERSCGATGFFDGTQNCVGILAGTGGELSCLVTDCTPCLICGDGICSTQEINSCPDDCNLAGPTIDVTCAGGQGLDTAIGCIPFTFVQRTTGFFLSWGIAIGGGFALLLIAYGSIVFMTSGGNPDNVARGKNIIFSGLAGLILISLSVFLLRVIGVDILQLFS